LGVGGALLAPAAVDVEVGEDAEQPGSEVRAGREGTPAAKGTGIGLLDEIFGLLFGPDEMPGDAIDLVGKCERFLLEPHAVACLLRQASGSLGASLAHRFTLPSAV